VIDALISNLKKFDTNVGYFKILKTNIEKQKKDCDIARTAKEKIQVDQVRQTYRYLADLLTLA
jgi:dethiobiotin synthetase